MKRLFLVFCVLFLIANLFVSAQEPTPSAAVPEPSEMAPPDSSAAPAAEENPEPVERAYAIPKMPMPAIPLGTAPQEYIGHRFYEEELESGGWGWVRLPNESWGQARWVAIQETPGVAVEPFRYKGSKMSDQNDEYRMTGYIAPYQVYDPHTDEMLDVFVLEKPCEWIGRAKPLHQTSGPKTRRFRFKPKVDSSNTSV